MRMKTRLAILGAVLSLALAGFIARAQETHKHEAKAASPEAKSETHEHAAAGEAITIKGEVLDLACYMAHEGKGEKHKSCAEACIKGGAPIGVLTAAGDVYLLVEDHDAKTPYEALKSKAAEQVEVSGTLQERGGLQAIVVSAVVKAK